MQTPIKRVEYRVSAILRASIYTRQSVYVSGFRARNYARPSRFAAVAHTSIHESTYYTHHDNIKSNISSDFGSSGNFELRQLMLGCSNPRELISLLQQYGPEIGPLDVATAWHISVQQGFLTLARSGDASEAALAAHLEFLAQQHAPEMPPSALSTTAWALAASTLGAADLMQSIIDYSIKKIITFEPPQLCTLLWASASHPALLNDPSDAKRQAPFVTIGSLIGDGMTLELFTPQDLSLFLWSVGMVGYIHQPTILHAESQCVARIHEFTPSQLAMTMYAFSMIKHVPINLRHAMEPKFIETNDAFDEFDAEDLTMLMVAYGKLNVDPGTRFLRKVSFRLYNMVPNSTYQRRTQKKGNSSSKEINNRSCTNQSVKEWYCSEGMVLHPIHITHTFWAYARFGYRPHDSAFTGKCLKFIEDNPSLFSAEDLNAILWACAELNIALAPSTLESVATQAMPMVKRQSPILVASMIQHMSAVTIATASGFDNNNVVSSNDTSTVPNVIKTVRKFVVVAMVSLLPHIEGLVKTNPEEVAGVIISLGTLEMNSMDRSLALNLQRIATMTVPQLSAEQLPRFAWAMIRLRWTNDVRLLDSIIAASSMRCPLMSSEGLAQLAWSFAGMNRPNAQLARVLVRQCTSKLGHFSGKDKARLIWACAHLSLRQEHSSVMTQVFLTELMQSLSTSELQKLDSVSLAALVWTCGRLEKHPGSVLNSIVACMKKKLKMYNKDQLQQMQTILSKHGCELI